MPLKPYGWINESSSTKKVEYFINLVTATTEYKVNNVIPSTPDSNTILLTCLVSPGSGPDVYSGSYNIPGSSSANKVIIVVMQDTTLKGKVVMRLNVNHFLSNPIKPFCWIKLISVSNTEVYSYIDLTAQNFSLSTSPTITTDSANHRITLEYTLNSISGSGIEEERVFNLSGYDPSTYEFVEINVKTPSGSTSKGKGTTSQSESDSSGDD